MINLVITEEEPLNLDKLWAFKSPNLVRLAFTERCKELFLASFGPHLFMYNSSIKILFANYWVVFFFFMVLGWNPGPGNCFTLDQYSDLAFRFGRSP